MPTFVGYPPDAIINLTNPGSDPVTGDNFQLDASFTFASEGLTFEITDDDTLFEGDVDSGEVGDDNTQSAQIYDALGNLTDSGQVYLEDVIEFTVDGQHVEIYRVEIAGVHVGWATTTALVPGDTQIVDHHENINEYHPVEYSTLFVCYAPGTLIDTPDGQRAVETLQVGDLVATLDHGPQPIRWVRSGDHALEQAEPDALPILIQTGAFGVDCPTRDLVVSPQHRILVGGCGQLGRLFDGQCFVPAKALTGLPRIRTMRGRKSITWVHFACDGHEVVTANGCYSESLLLGPMVLNGLTRLQRSALVEIFGKASAPNAALNGPAARDCLPVGKVRRVIEKLGRAGVAAALAA